MSHANLAHITWVRADSPRSSWDSFSHLVPQYSICKDLFALPIEIEIKISKSLIFIYLSLS